MEILTEVDLRAARITTSEYRVLEGVFVTPLAREYLKERGIRLIRTAAPDDFSGAMSVTQVKESGTVLYRDALTGETYQKKPEHMTHLCGNLLVSKSHPRIRFRGQLDSLQARIVLLQSEQSGSEKLCRDLGELLHFVQEILGAEVKEIPVRKQELFGWGYEELREKSHHVREEFGFDHPIPSCTMDRQALELNVLRTEVREAELSAVASFPDGDVLGVIQAMNRLSSGVYILFCRVLAGYYG